MPESSYRRQLPSALADPYSSSVERSRMLVRFAAAFGGLAFAVSVALAVLAALRIVTAQIFIPLLLSLLLVGAIIASTLWFTRATWHRLATLWLLYGLVLYLTILVHLFNGVDGPAAFGYLLPIMAAGILGEARDAVRIFLAALGCYVVLALLELNALLLPILTLTSPGRQLIFLVAFAGVGTLLAYLARLWSNTTAQLLAQAQEQSEAILRSNEKLIEKNIQQVELGSELSAAAAQLLAASHQQASGASEQASAVSQVSTTIEQLGSTARQIAIAAEQVATAAQQTLENLSDGQDAVDRSIQAMERIRGRVQDVSARVLSLGERSQQIGEIIDLINDLSDETHLLALNAAIEAAGAGEHGRRFAVVAAEVKSLANRALAAAKEVKGVIAEIQQATNAAVLAAEEGGKEVERGVELAYTAGQVMDAIVMVAERSAQSGAEINLATAQQQSASEQVVETMREVADVARQTSAGARQMSESAQMLTAIAERLHGIAYASPQAPTPRPFLYSDEHVPALTNHKR
jgi:methyl-accepting chemotaxis protein